MKEKTKQAKVVSETIVNWSTLTCMCNKKTEKISNKASVMFYKC